jgi:hypothetical protein
MIYKSFVSEFTKKTIELIKMHKANYKYDFTFIDYQIFYL